MNLSHYQFITLQRRARSRLFRIIAVLDPTSVRSFHAFSQAIFLSYLFMWEPLKYGEDIEYPFYMHAIGFGMSLSSMLWIPGYAIYYVLSQRGSFRDVSLLN